MADWKSTEEITKKNMDRIYSSKTVNSSVLHDAPGGITPYHISAYSNYYKTIPYALRIVSVANNTTSLPFADNIGGTDKIDCFFPINPESLTINTPYAVAVTPTVGGIVQEHSGAVFYSITISGTTGVLPAYDVTTGEVRPISDTRPVTGAQGIIPSGALGGFGANTINAINSTVSAITGDSTHFAATTGNSNTGYTAFHYLYRFLWLYHQTKANAKTGGPVYQLRFVNFKDNNKYDCVVQNFALSRDKSRPHLYNYTISLQGWKLQDATSETRPKVDSAARLKELGLDEGPSVKAKIFRAINTTKTVLNGVSGTVRALAQDTVF